MVTKLGDRINIVGSPGSGKTTLCRHLSDRLGCAHIELDRLFWRPGWVQTDDENFFAQIAEAVAAERWVACGNYTRARSVLWSRVQTIIWLDYGYWRTFGRLLRRTSARSVTRYEAFPGCPESWKTSLFSKDSILYWQLTTHRKRKLQYSSLMADPDWAHLQWLHFRSPRETEGWLNSL
jgi:adenylate kinase family enzyme